MSFRSHFVAPSRVFDHLYDQTFVTSSAKNLYKENCMALTRSAPIHIHPSDNSMFSELTYEQRNYFVYQRNFLPHLPPITNINDSNSHRMMISVGGADRSKFFSSPSGNVRTINVGLTSETATKTVGNDNDGGADIDKRKPEIKCKSTSIQTLYRESSAQTRPWLPEISCFTAKNASASAADDDDDDDDHVPEVVYVADMIDSVTYPGLREVEIVERARKRRMWENALPPIKSPEEIPSRAAALEAFEWEEWLAREKDINECQQARLKIVADLISKRERRHLDQTNQKLENCRKRILDEKKHQKDILIRNYQRSMRKLDLAKRKSTNLDKLKDPVLSHYDKKMEYSFPKIRLDAISKKRTQIEYSNDFQTKFKLIEEENLPSNDLQKYLEEQKRQLWKPKQPIKEFEHGIWNENYLKKLHETLKQFRQKSYGKKRKTPKCMIFESTSNEISSKVSSSSANNDATDEIYQNTIHIQKSIKGRAIQSLLMRGVEKFRDVIDEAKATHSIASIRKLFPKEFSHQIDNQQHILDEYKRIEDALKNDVKLQEELKKVECRDAGNLLNFLERELQRLDGEKRSHAMYLLAERERYSRQAALMGKLEFEEQFKNDAITLYLENVLMNGIQRAAADGGDETMTRHYIREVAKKIDRKANKNVTFHDDDAEEFSCESNTESVSEDSLEFNEIPDQKVVMEMLRENMMPQIMNRIKSEQMLIRQRRFLSSAHQHLFREEFERQKCENDKRMCAEIFDEILDMATFDVKSPSLSTSSDSSREANELAGEIVRNILNEMIDRNFQFSSTTCESTVSGESYDGDYSNVQSTDGDSTAELLAHQVVENVLHDILQQTFTPSSSEINEESAVSSDVS